MRVYAVTALAILTHAAQVLAWGAVGHEVVATIAQAQLQPAAYASICRILGSDGIVSSSSPSADDPPCHLAPVASWADKVRMKMHWSQPLHFINPVGDEPRATCPYPGDGGWEGPAGAHVLSAIHNVTGILADWVKGGEDDHLANEALKFLIHFVGDLHQPLHLCGRQKGGNGVKVLFGRKHTNLHSVWDSLIIAKTLRTVPRKYSRAIPSQEVERVLTGTIYDSYVRMIMWEGVLGDKWKSEVGSWPQCSPSAHFGTQQQVLGKKGKGADEWDTDTVCPYAWSSPIHQLNCDIVWPPETDAASFHAHEDTHEHASTVEEEMAMVRALELAPNAEGDLPDLDTPEYAGKIGEDWIIEELLAKGGVRLGAILNGLFANAGN